MNYKTNKLTEINKNLKKLVVLLAVFSVPFGSVVFGAPGAEGGYIDADRVVADDVWAIDRDFEKSRANFGFAGGFFGICPPLETFELPCPVIVDGSTEWCTCVFETTCDFDESGKWRDKCVCTTYLIHMDCD